MKSASSRALLAAALIGVLPVAGCGSENVANSWVDGGSAPADGGIAPITDGGADSDGTARGICLDGAPDLCGTSSFTAGTIEDVVTIGDSYMNLLLRGLEKSLSEVSGHSYRNYGAPGAFLLNGDIPNQYAAAVQADPVIDTVVMTGGGNDVLASDCTGTCQELVDRVYERIAELKKRMADDGVKDVIIVSYGYPADETRRAALDYFRRQLAQSCREDAAPRCNYVDPVKELEGKISSDGVHPTAEGFDVLARMVWDLMQAKDMRR